MLGRRQANTIGYDNDDDDDDSLLGYSVVSVNQYLCKKCVAHTSADRSSHKMGRRWCDPCTTRTVACLGTRTRSTKDQARSASDGIPQGTTLQASR